jgi:hypothetical protein
MVIVIYQLFMEIKMIIDVKIMKQPISGNYKERIYDISSQWNSQKWTWIRFINDDFSEWYGEFRGEARGVALSNKYNTILILTSDYLYLLDCLNEEIVEYEEQTQYLNVTVTPSGDFIVSDYYNIKLIRNTIRDTELLYSPIKMDMIKFYEWNENKLLIICEEFLNWSNTVMLELDGETFEITIK